MRPEKRSWCSRIAQPGQFTNLLGQRRTALVFALDQFNLPGKRYSFAHAKTARRPSCCGCVAFGRSGHLPATLLAKGWEKCKVRSETKTAVLKSSLMTTRARARSQQHKWPQLTHGLRHGLPASCRSSEKLESGLRLIKPVRASGETEASCSAIRAVRPKRSPYGTLTGGMDAVGRGTKPILCWPRAASIITKATKRITRPRIQKRLQYL